MSKDQYRDELHALRGELGDATTVASSSEATPSESETKLEQALGELHRYLTSAAAEAEEVVAEHPMASLAAAFCLGMIVGRVSGGFK